MIFRSSLAVAVAMTALAPMLAAADVRVTDANPRQLGVGDFRSISERAAAIGELRRYLQWLGRTHLKPGQDLSVEVLDLKLAGELVPFGRGAYDVRVLTSVTPPRITLKYALRQNGRVTRRGTEQLSDMNYQWRSPGRASSDTYAYEKDMLRDWFEEKIARGRS